MTAPAASTAPTPPKRENLLINIVCNILLPSLILGKLSDEARLGPVWSLVAALAFPVGYGLYDFARRRQANFISIIGFASVLLTGGFGLMKVDGFWFACKEAAVPTVIGVAVLVSLKTRRPLVRELLFNEQIIDVPKVHEALEANGKTNEFEVLLVRSSYLLAASFLLSAVLNFGLARYLLQSPSGTPAFNEELGKMNLLSWPVIVLPSMAMTMYALWKLLRGIEALTGLDLESLFHGKHQQPAGDAGGSGDSSGPAPRS